MYSGLIQPMLFRIEPERAHQLALYGLRLAAPLLRNKLPDQRCQIMGLSFRNPVGLAAGLDKNGDFIDALAVLGFGFIEVGTVTPLAQPGNPKPRMFRLPAAEALINRLGFNNKGVDHLVERLRKTRYTGVVGVNIGKNLNTPVERAVEDYLLCLRKVYPHAHYVTVNISSPNTPGLRTLQHGEQLEHLLRTLKREQRALATESDRYVPLAVKVAPDLTADEVERLAATLVTNAVDAVIATNTTNSRDGLGAGAVANAAQQGGLSGAPLTARANEVLRQLATALQGRIPIIGVGGIMSGADARAKREAGASLVQLYTGLIYRGPGLVREVARALS